MNRTKLYYTALLVIFLEGYIVLASELIAIRILAANISSTTDVISIVISAVLLPLSFGYYFGGKFSEGKSKKSIRKKLTKNFTSALVQLTIAFNYIIVIFFFTGFNQVFKNHYIVTTLIYCLVFLAYPVFLLGQTIPLISNYFLKHNLSSLSGKILSFSTVGSLFGSLLSTLVLMPLIGLNNTIISTIFLTVVMILIIDRRKNIINKVICALCLVAIWFSNSDSFLRSLSILKDNEYHTIRIIENNSENEPGLKTRFFAANNAAYSILTFKDDKLVSKSQYLDYVEQYLITDNAKPKEILVLGAGGFAFGIDDEVNHYTYVDIDKDLKEVAEKYFLKKKLGKNKEFEVISAKLFVKNADKKYDFILLDTFNGRSIPQQLITVEFFRDIKKILNENGLLIINFIDGINFSTAFATKFDNSVRQVFSHYYVSPIIAEGLKKATDLNLIYVISNKQYQTDDVYTDDKSEYYQDRLKKVR